MSFASPQSLLVVASLSILRYDMASPHILPLMLLPLHISLCLSVAVNRTIDDKNGDSVTGAVPSYIPESPQWIQGDQCSFCSINSAIIDVDQVHNGTWHDATYLTSTSSSELVVAFDFEGSAVYIYNIIVNQISSSSGPVVTATNLSFHIDGVNVGQFTRTPDDSKNVLYNVPVYVNTSLENKQHTMQIRAGGKGSSLILFDYAQYTVEEDESDPSTTSSTPWGAPSSSLSVSSHAPTSNAAQTRGPTSSMPKAVEIVLICIGAVVAAIAAGGGLAFCISQRRGKRQTQIRQSHKIDLNSPFSPIAEAAHEPHRQSLEAIPRTYYSPLSGEPYCTARRGALHTSDDLLSPDAYSLEVAASNVTTYSKVALMERIDTLETHIQMLRRGDCREDSGTHGLEGMTQGCPPRQSRNLEEGEPMGMGERTPESNGNATMMVQATATFMSEMRRLMREMGVLRAELAVREQQLPVGTLPTYTEAIAAANTDGHE